MRSAGAGTLRGAARARADRAGARFFGAGTATAYNRGMRTHALVLVAALAVAPRARADIQKNGPEEWPGKNEISAHTGFQQGLTGFTYGGTTTGFRLMAEYGFRFHRLMWLNFGANLVVGGACDDKGHCGYAAGGSAIEPQAGLKIKWQPPIPLVPYVKFAAVVPIIWGRFCGDNGFAIGGRVAGGAKYFLTKNIGVGVEFGFMVGPGFFSGTSCANPIGSHVEIYAEADFNVGAEFVF